MIARVWSAWATPSSAPRYAGHLESSVLPELRRLEGYEGALLLERETGDEVELQVVTFWRSLDAIRAFAGADPERAVVAPEAAAVLERFDQRVRHYRVAARDRV